MKKLGMKNLLVILLSVLMNLWIGHDGRLAGTAFFCAAYAMLPGKMLLAVATLSGMAYALPMTAFIRYAGLMTTVMALDAVIKRISRRNNEMADKGPPVPLVIYGLMVLAVITAGIGYGVAFGANWQDAAVRHLPGIAEQFLAASLVYWGAIGGIALINGWRPAFPRKRRNVRLNEEALVTKNQLHAFSESFRKLSESFETDTQPRHTLNQQEVQDIFNAVTEAVCKDCSRCSYCWENVFEDSCETAYEILDMCTQKAEMHKKDLPERFRQRCVRADNFLSEARRMTGMAQMNLSWQNKLAESRLVLAGQFGEVAEVIGDFSRQIGDEPLKQDGTEKQIIRHLSARKIHVRRIAASEKPNGRKCVYIEARVSKNEERPVQEAADIIGRVYGRRYLPMSETSAVIGSRWQMFAFEEDVRYRTIVGDARMVRMGERVSGDSYTIMHMDSGQVVLSLSDGMGSGEKAEQESNRIISLLEQLLTTGFNRQSAVRLIHSVVLAGSEPHIYSTLDLGSIDLFSGHCELVKMGAAASFIKNGDQIRQIISDALPPGALPEPEDEVQTARMDDGDMLIMMSDGILNSLGESGNEAAMTAFLKNCPAVSPQELANSVLNHAMACSHYEAEDDMTVLVCGLYRKQAI